MASAREIRVVIGVVHHDIRGFVFQFHLAEFARFVPENDDLLVLGQQQHAVARLGGGQAGENSSAPIAPLRRAADGDLVVVVDGGLARGGFFLLESQDGEPALIIGPAGVRPRPTGVGVSILAAERDADFQIGVGAIGHQVGEAGRLASPPGSGRGGWSEAQPASSAGRSNPHRVRKIRASILMLFCHFAAQSHNLNAKWQMQNDK